MADVDEHEHQKITSVMSAATPLKNTGNKNEVEVENGMFTF